MALFWRIWAAVALVNLAVLTIFVALATLQFGNINANLVGERLAVLAERTAAPFEAAAGIGLPLSTVRNADALLERARQTDSAIRAIHVFEADGTIVHSTAKPAPAAIPTDAAILRKDAKGVPWYREGSDDFLSGIEIVTRTKASAGGILIVYPNSASLVQVQAMAAELALSGIAVLLVSAVASALLLRLGLARQIELFENVEAAIVDFERGAWRGAAGRPSALEGADGDTLRDLLAEAERRYVTAGRALAAARDKAE
jgi:hypothetical protein